LLKIVGPPAIIARPMKGIIHPIVAPGGSPPIERIPFPRIAGDGKGQRLIVVGGT